MSIVNDMLLFRIQKIVADVEIAESQRDQFDPLLGVRFRSILISVDVLISGLSR